MVLGERPKTRGPMEPPLEATLARLARDLHDRGIDFSTPAAAEAALRNLQSTHEEFHVRAAAPSPCPSRRYCLLTGRK
jgi:hypothetical protein